MDPMTSRMPDTKPAPSAAAAARGPRPKLGTYTLHDVATRAGVSKVTASRYFNEPDKVSESLRERIAAVVRETGYVPNQVARRLASSQGGVVGAVMQNVASPTFADMVRGMSDGFEAAGLQLLLANSQFSIESEERAIRAFLGWHPSALILTRGDHSEVTDATLAGLAIPVVEAWEVMPGRPFHQVGFAQDAVGGLLAAHFLAQGATRVAFVLSGLASDARAHRRAEGYARTLREAGLTPELIRCEAVDDLAAGQEAMARLAARPAGDRPRALIFANDNMALAAILKAPHLGLSIPADCAIAGFGDVPVASIIEPALTTVRTAPYRIGRCTADTVLALLAAPPGTAQPARSQQVDCELVVRDSSRIAPDGRPGR